MHIASHRLYSQAIDQQVPTGDAAIEVTPQPASLPAKPRLWTVFLAVLNALALAGILQTIAVIALIAWDVSHGIEAEEAAKDLPNKIAMPAMFILMAACGQLAFGLTALIGAWLSPIPMRERLGLLPPEAPWTVYPLTMLGSLVPLAIGFALAIPLGSFLPGDPSVMKLYENMTLADAVPFVLFIAIVPAIVEELLFRGYVQRRLLQRWRPATALIVTALIFALMHIAPLAVVALFPLGLWLGVVAWRTNSVYPTILCHAFINGSVNMWRVFVKFSRISETAQMAFVVTTLVVSVVCFIAALRMLIAKHRAAPSLVIQSVSS